MNIKDLPINDRPREKALKYGIDSISNAELLSIFIRSGTKGKSVIDVSYEVLNKFNGITGLINANINELNKIKGINNVKAIELLAAIELSKRINDIVKIGEKINDGVDVYNLVGDKLKSEQQEHFVLILLDTKNNLINYKYLYKGGLNYHLIHMRDIFREVVKNNAYKFICVHNHPTGDPTPSKNDFYTTKQIIESSALMGITFEDHIIIGNNCFYSFKESTSLFINK